MVFTADCKDDSGQMELQLLFLEELYTEHISELQYIVV